MKKPKFKFVSRALFGLLLGACMMTVAFESPSVEKSEETLAQSAHALNYIAQKAIPAVVSISSVKVAPEEDVFPDEMPSWLKPHPKHSPHHNEPFMMDMGSGIIIRPDGTILTNYHVVKNAQQITVDFDNKKRSSAHVVGADPKTDLAVIKINKDMGNLPTLPFGDSTQIRVGDWAIAVGSPFGLNRSVTAGIVSAKGRDQLGMTDVEDYIQTDAAINPGNSGGPLLDAKGEVIGVNTAIFSENGGFIGIGFAIPSRIAKQVSDEIIIHGRVIRGWIGLIAQDMNEDLAAYFKVGKLTSQKGALVSEVLPSGPAGHTSIRVGDVLLKYNGRDIESASQLKSLVAKTKPHTLASMEVLHNGKTRTLKIPIEEQVTPHILGPVQQAGTAALQKTAGLAVEDIPPDLGHVFHILPQAGALVTEVKPGTPAFDAGLSPGDVILSADQKPVKNAKEFNQIMKTHESDPIALLYVQHGPRDKVFVPLKTQPG